MRSPLPEELDLAELFERHRDGLAGAVRGVLGPLADVREILQEAFLRVWRARARGTLAGDPVGFIFVVTLNVARDLRRRYGRARSATPLEEVPEMHLRSAEPPPAERAERAEAVAAARLALEELKDAEKDVFFLRVAAGLTFDAVAENLGIPVGTAKTRMRSALAALRRTLRPHSPTLESGRELR